MVGSNAQRYILTGEEFTAHQALGWGMIQELVELDQLHDRARELAKKITKVAPLGVQSALRSSKESRVNGQKVALGNVFVDLPSIMKSEDAREGVNSFLERRDAIFTGK